MLDVVFNDLYSNLSLIVINGDEGFKVIDQDFKVYAEKQGTPFEIEPNDFIVLWDEAIEKYYAYDTTDDHISKYADTMKKDSKRLFKKFIEKEFKEDTTDDQ